MSSLDLPNGITTEFLQQPRPFARETFSSRCSFSGSEAPIRFLASRKDMVLLPAPKHAPPVSSRLRTAGLSHHTVLAEWLCSSSSKGSLSRRELSSAGLFSHPAFVWGTACWTGRSRGLSSDPSVWKHASALVLSIMSGKPLHLAEPQFSRVYNGVVWEVENGPQIMSSSQSLELSVAFSPPMATPRLRGQERLEFSKAW